MSIALKGFSGQTGVGDELGKSGTVKLSELNTTHATTRVYGTGGGQYPYKRVNSNEEARYQAPSGSEAQSDSSGTGTANSLAKWDGYLQWNPSEEVGDEMTVATKSCSAASICSVKFTFDHPAGYTNFHQGSVQQQFYVKLCSDQNEAEECEDNPLDGTGTLLATGDLEYLEAVNVGTLQENKWYIGTVRMQWNDELTSGSPYTRSGAGYTAASGYSASWEGIAFQMPAAPQCVQHDIGLSSIVSEEDGREDACFDSSYGYKSGVGAQNSFSAGDTVWNSGCSGSNPTGLWIAVNGVSYAYSSGTIVANGYGVFDCVD